MGRRLVVGVVLASACLGTWLATAAAGQERPRSAVMQLDLTGVVDPFVAGYVEDGIREANEQGYAAVLVVVDTPGGLSSSMREIVQAVLSSRVPVVCFTAPSGARAASAGTFVMMACPVAAMAPGTSIGAAHPVGISGAIELQKAENDAAAFLRSLAETRDRNARWAESAVRDSVSASAEEARDLDVVDLLAPDVPSLLRALDGRTVEVAGDRTRTLTTTGLAIERREMGAGASILHALLDPTLAFVFFYVGLALLVVEIFVPGGVAGTIGAVVLVLAVVALGMLPVQLLGLVLLVASVAFFLLELKVPGIGVPSAAGAATLVLGALFLFDSSVPAARVSPWVIAPMALFAVGFFVFVLRAAIRLRRQPAGDGGSLVGRVAVVVRELAPVGVVQIASEEWTAESEHGPVPKGARVLVVEVDGLRLKVVAVDEATDAGIPAVRGSLEGGER